MRIKFQMFTSLRWICHFPWFWYLETSPAPLCFQLWLSSWQRLVPEIINCKLTTSGMIYLCDFTRENFKIRILKPITGPAPAKNFHNTHFMFQQKLEILFQVFHICNPVYNNEGGLDRMDKYSFVCGEGRQSWWRVGNIWIFDNIRNCLRPADPHLQLPRGRLPLRGVSQSLRGGWVRQDPGRLRLLRYSMVSSTSCNKSLQRQSQKKTELYFG